MLGQDQHASCVWRACDPYTTEAVHGVEGNGQSSNCGRTNKDGVDFVKAEHPHYGRYLALYQTPQEANGCKDCRFFMMCKGQCPGTSLDGDWRNRSELCGVWKQVFSHLEQKLIQRQQEPLSIHPQRALIERHMFEQWANGHNIPIHACISEFASTKQVTNTVETTRAFHIPPFVRHAFVGEAQRSIWQPRLTAIHTDLARLGVLAVNSKVIPLAQVSVSPSQVFEIHNLAATDGLHARLLFNSAHTQREKMVIGGEQITAQYQAAWKAQDHALLDQLAGLPSCCQAAHQRLLLTGYSDPAWLLLAANPTQASTEVDLHAPPLLNMLLKPLDINLLGYQPCHPNCEASQPLANELIALGYASGMTKTMDWLAEILDWPAEWSALHGIAELKTGIIKVSYNTDFTHEKQTIRYHGHTLAANAVRGLSFAYRKPPNQRRTLAVRTTAISI